MLKGKYSKILFICVSFCVCGILYSCSRQDSVSITSLEQNTSKQQEDTKETGSTLQSSHTILVYVCGEVANPGVYECSEDARIIEAVTAAGGMTEKAAKNQINLAQRISDGQMIMVMSEEDVKKSGGSQASAQLERGKSTDNKVNLNTADEQTLMSLPGIGASKASSIIAYREQNGGFQSVQQLMEIEGIKEGVFNKIKDLITVN